MAIEIKIVGEGNPSATLGIGVLPGRKLPSIYVYDDGGWLRTLGSLRSQEAADELIALLTRISKALPE